MWPRLGTSSQRFLIEGTSKNHSVTRAAVLGATHDRGFSYVRDVKARAVDVDQTLTAVPLLAEAKIASINPIEALSSVGVTLAFVSPVQAAMRLS